MGILVVDANPRLGVAMQRLENNLPTARVAVVSNSTEARCTRIVEYMGSRLRNRIAEKIKARNAFDAAPPSLSGMERKQTVGTPQLEVRCRASHDRVVHACFVCEATMCLRCLAADDACAMCRIRRGSSRS